MSKVYSVLSREYSYTEPVMDDGSGPTYDTRDFVFVTAPNKRIAKINGLKAFRKTRAAILDEDQCPFAGMKVEEVTNAEELKSVMEGYKHLFHDFTAA